MKRTPAKVTSITARNGEQLNLMSENTTNKLLISRRGKNNHILILDINIHLFNLNEKYICLCKDISQNVF